MNDFDFASFLQGFVSGETKEQIIKKYLDGVYSKDEFMTKMKEWEDRNG